MPNAPKDRRLTPLETLIMNSLWEQSPAAVREVQERLKSVKPMAYNTVLTMMRILRQKGFLTSERQGRADVYQPAVNRADVARRSLADVMNAFFSGSAHGLVSQLLDADSLSDEELAAIGMEVDQALKARKRGGAA